MTTQTKALDYYYSGRDEALFMSGLFYPDDAPKFKALVSQYTVSKIFMESPGGDFGAATEIAKIVYDNKISTYAVTGCYSACAYIWYVGAERYSYDGVEVGIHAPYFIDPLTGMKLVDDTSLILLGYFFGYVNDHSDLPLKILDNSLHNNNEVFDLTKIYKYHLYSRNEAVSILFNSGKDEDKMDPSWLTINKDKPLATFLVGMPCTGKSTFRQKMIETMYPYDDTGAPIILSTDDYLESMATDLGITYSEVFESYMGAANGYLNTELNLAVKYKVPVIWDQTNLTVSARIKKYKKLVDTHDIHVVFFPKEKPEVLYGRMLKVRPDKVIPLSVLDNMYNQYEDYDGEREAEYVVGFQHNF